MGKKELTHYGVKGMKWGVRKARTGDLNVRASRLERVASGKGSKADKIVSIGGSTLGSLAVRGLKKESARRAANYRAEERRLATGQAKTRDVIAAYGNVSVYSLIGSRNKGTDHELK